MCWVGKGIGLGLGRGGGAASWEEAAIGLHLPPGSLYEYQKKRVAGGAVCMNMKTKGLGEVRKNGEEGASQNPVAGEFAK